MKNGKRGGEREYLLQLIDTIDNKNKTIVDLLLEIYRLRKILTEHSIDYRRKQSQRLFESPTNKAKHTLPNK
jgi:hypothetical protein